MKMYGWWRFFKKPGGLELAFLITRNLSLLPFFYFFYSEQTVVLMADFVVSELRSCARVSNFGAG